MNKKNINAYFNLARILRTIPEKEFERSQGLQDMLNSYIYLEYIYLEREYMTYFAMVNTHPEPKENNLDNMNNS